MGNAVLMLDELNLLPSREEAAVGAWWFEAGGDDADLGNPERTVVEIISQLLQGSAVTSGPVGNREVSFRVTIKGADSGALAEGAAELTRVCDRQGLKSLAFLAPDRASALTVFDVLIATAVHEFDDFQENYVQRAYVLTLTCKPWPRSEEMVEDAPPALPGQPEPAPPAPVVADDGGDASAWTTRYADYGPTTARPSGHTWAPESGTAVWVRGASRAHMWHPGNVDATGYRFMHITGYAGTRKNDRVTHGETLHFWVEGVERKPARLSRNRTTGAFSAWLYVGDVTVTTFGVQAVAMVGSAPGVALAVDEVRLDAGAPSVTSAHVSARVVDVVGSKPAEASIQVSGYDSAGAPALLGRETIIYTTAADGSQFQPSLADSRTGGPIRTASDAPISGSTSLMAGTLAEADTFLIPVSELPPGTYQIAAYMNGRFTAGVRAINWRARTELGGGAFGDPADGGANVDLLQEEWLFCTLGEVVLPVLPSEDAPEDMGVRLAVWAPSNDVWFDTLMLFNITTGTVSVINTHNNGAQRTVGVRIDAPWAERPQQTTWIDNLTTDDVPYTLNGSNRVMASGLHHMNPGPVMVWAATTASEFTTVGVSYFPRWDSFAVGDAWVAPPLDLEG